MVVGIVGKLPWYFAGGSCQKGTPKCASEGRLGDVGCWWLLAAGCCRRCECHRRGSGGDSACSSAPHKEHSLPPARSAVPAPD